MVARKPTSPSPYTQATLEKLTAGPADSADVIRLAVQCWAEWESRDRPCSKLVADIFDAVMRIFPSGTRLASASDTTTPTRTSRMAPDGEYLMRPGHVILWDVASGEEVWRFVDEEHAYFGVAFSPDGRRLGMGGGRGVLTMLDGTPVAESPRFQPFAENP